MREVRTILVVDDSLLARKMVSAFAAEVYPDAVILTAETGEQALERVRDAVVQLATIDYSMPGMDGLTLAERLRRLQPDARLALITANAQDDVIARAERLGVEFVHKPITQQSVEAFLLGKSRAT